MSRKRSAPTFFAKLPSQFGPILNSGILLTATTAVLLNIYFNGLGSRAAAAAVQETAELSEA